ncbi:MAG: hypothetical protein KDC80_15190 [Saprospiraceae bacterium]|nr:hypothetical protein [Saprospiraceae bacterium]
MRLLIAFFFSILCYQGICSKVAATALDYEFICTELVYFTAPAQTQYDVGDDIYVRLDCGNPQYIHSVRLYLGHQLVGVDGTAPYEFCRPNLSEHPALRNMQAGKYALTAKVRYTCGNYRHITKNIKVGYSRPVAVIVGDQNLTWLKNLKHQRPDWSLAEYKVSARSYIKAVPCNEKSGKILWYNMEGKIVGRFPHNTRYQGIFQNAKLIKVIADPCRN